MSAAVERSTRTPYWHTMLCAETVDEIADRMREVLEGNYFTVVTCNSYDPDSSRFTAVDVVTSQRITDPIKVRDPDDGYSSIGWGTQRWAMGVHSRATTRSEGHDGRPHNYCQVAFEPGKVEIDHFAPAGYRLLWIFTVERHDDGDDA